MAALRRRSARWLGGARRVIVPTADTKRRLAQYFPAIEADIEPLEVPATLGSLPPAGGEATEAGPIRVALIGGIGVHKGYDVLLACAKDAARRQLPLEFTVVGHTEDDARLMATGKVFVTGRYEEEEIEALLRRERPHVAWFASVVPETWCYALSHAIRAGLPIFASDLGALGERLAGVPYATLVAPDMAPAALNRRFLTAIEEVRARKKVKLIDPAARGTPPEPGSARPAQERTIPESKGKIGTMKQISAEATQDRLTVSVQVLNLAEGIYAFLVRSTLPAKASWTTICCCRRCMSPAVRMWAAARSNS